MAGRARFQALKAQLDRDTLEYFDLDPVDLATGAAQLPSYLDLICAKLESAQSVTRQAADLSKAVGFEITYERLMAFLREEYGRDSVATALKDAKSRASHCFAEQGMEIVDEPQYDSVGVQRARARANQRNWMAERYNATDYGGKQGVSVNVSIGSLHLDALRSRPIEVTAALKVVSEPSSDTLAQPSQPIAIQAHTP